MHSSEPRSIVTPLDEAALSSLRAGDLVLLSGSVHTARDAAHRRMAECLEKRMALPLSLAGQVIYYAGPAPAKPGHVIGPIGPTTSTRMDPYTPLLLAQGLKGMIGKGRRSPEVIRAIREHGAVYLGATGGAAALLARCVRSVRTVAYEDLGPEAIRELLVEDLPLVVVVDSRGTDLYEIGPAAFARREGDS